MNANELADYITENSYIGTVTMEDVATMLRQQQARIKQLEEPETPCEELRRLQNMENIYKTFEEWKAGQWLEDGEPRTKAYTDDELVLVEMGWQYGFDAGKAESAKYLKQGQSTPCEYTEGM